MQVLAARHSGCYLFSGAVRRAHHFLRLIAAPSAGNDGQGCPSPLLLLLRAEAHQQTTIPTFPCAAGKPQTGSYEVAARRFYPLIGVRLRTRPLFPCVGAGSRVTLSDCEKSPRSGLPKTALRADPSLTLRMTGMGSPFSECPTQDTIQRGAKGFHIPIFLPVGFGLANVHRDD